MKRLAKWLLGISVFALIILAADAAYCEPVSMAVATGGGLGLGSALGIGAGSAAAGGLLGFLGSLFGAKPKQKDPKMMYNQYGIAAFNEIMRSLDRAQYFWQEALEGKPWLINTDEQKRADKGIKDIQSLIREGKFEDADRILETLPYFGQLYTDQLVYKSPVFSPLLQTQAVRDMLGIYSPTEERRLEDMTGSSRRMLGEQKQQALDEADRLAALSGRGGAAPAEHLQIIDKYLRTYGDQEKDIRNMLAGVLADKMLRGTQVAQQQQSFGRESVALGHQYKSDAQSAINQILSLLPGAAQSTVAGGGAYRPDSGGQTRQALGAGFNTLGAAAENIGGMAIMDKYMNSNRSGGISAADLYENYGTDWYKALPSQYRPTLDLSASTRMGAGF